MSKYQSTQKEFDTQAQAQDVATLLEGWNTLSNYWPMKARTAGGAYKNTFVVGSCNKHSGRWYGFVSNFSIIA